MNVFFREIKANLKSLLIWCGAQVFVIFAGMVKYGGYTNSSVDINDLMEQFPEALRAVFGMGSVDLATIEGFYAVFFLFFILLAAIHAAMLGAVLIAKEERDHAADFLYAKPVQRWQVITAKMMAGLVNLVVLNIVTLVTSVISIASYNDGDMLADKVLVLMVALLILQILFFCLGTALGALLKTAKLATSAATAIILATFFLAAAIDIDHRIQSLHILTPFKYFDANDLLHGGRLPVWTALLTLVLSAIALAVTYIAFKRRDLAV